MYCHVRKILKRDTSGDIYHYKGNQQRVLQPISSKDITRIERILIPQIKKYEQHADKIAGVRVGLTDGMRMDRYSKNQKKWARSQSTKFNKDTRKHEYVVVPPT